MVTEGKFKLKTLRTLFFQPPTPNLFQITQTLEYLGHFLYFQNASLFQLILPFIPSNNE